MLEANLGYIVELQASLYYIAKLCLKKAKGLPGAIVVQHLPGMSEAHVEPQRCQKAHMYTRTPKPPTHCTLKPQRNLDVWVLLHSTMGMLAHG